MRNIRPYGGGPPPGDEAVSGLRAASWEEFAAANVGTALLVFLAAFDVRLAILFLIGITGLMISFKVAVRAEALLGASTMPG